MTVEASYWYSYHFTVVVLYDNHEIFMLHTAVFKKSGEAIISNSLVERLKKLVTKPSKKPKKSAKKTKTEPEGQVGDTDNNE